MKKPKSIIIEVKVLFYYILYILNICALED